MDIHLEKMEAAIHSIGADLEETIKHRVADILSYVAQKTQGLCKELTEMIDEAQVDLQAIRTSVDMPKKSLLETIRDTREHLHEELGLMIQSETQMTKTLTDIMRRGLEAR
jgi:DNA anti-recombination protein RmuC